MSSLARRSDRLSRRPLALGMVTCLACTLFAALPAQAEEVSALQKEAQGIPQVMVPRLMEVLSTEIAQGGEVGAIGVCRDKAPQMAKALSEKTGWAIRRVSLKNRNPKATPDAWEKAVLEEFDRRQAAGEDPSALEKYQVVEENGQRTARYMKALPAQEMCLACHGSAERIAPDVAAKLKALYPDDRATGYRAMEIRGAITAKKSL